MKDVLWEGQIKEQALLCSLMFKRLGADIQEASSKEEFCGGLAGRSRLTGDITRLRRELLKLSKIIEGRDA